MFLKYVHECVCVCIYNYAQYTHIIQTQTFILYFDHFIIIIISD